MCHQVADTAHFILWNLPVGLLEFIRQMVCKFADLQNGHGNDVAIGRTAHEIFPETVKGLMRRIHFIAVFQNVPDNVPITINAGHKRELPPAEWWPETPARCFAKSADRDFSESPPKDHCTWRSVRRESECVPVRCENRDRSSAWLRRGHRNRTDTSRQRRIVGRWVRRWL